MTALWTTCAVAAVICAGVGAVTAVTLRSDCLEANAGLPGVADWGPRQGCVVTMPDGERVPFITVRVWR